LCSRIFHVKSQVCNWLLGNQLSAWHSAKCCNPLEITF
jgi:hypothetical protein